MKSLIPIAFCLLATGGCVSQGRLAGSAAESVSGFVTGPESEPLTVLSMIGGLCLLAGMALLVVTRGTKGWYPVIGGLILVVLNYMVAKYDDLIFYPLVAATGVISAAWTYKTVRQILVEKKRP